MLGVVNDSTAEQKEGRCFMISSQFTQKGAIAEAI
jgi:hypothetical protein